MMQLATWKEGIMECDLQDITPASEVVISKIIEKLIDERLTSSNSS